MRFVLFFLLLIPGVVSADMMTAKKGKCLRCHHATKKMQGPTFEQLAEKFSLSDVDRLVAEVRKGRRGAELTWGKIKMPASKASEADIRTAIEWMLTQ